MTIVGIVSRFSFPAVFKYSRKYTYIYIYVYICIHIYIYRYIYVYGCIGFAIPYQSVNGAFLLLDRLVDASGGRWWGKSA